MPASFWSGVRSDGANIRAATPGGTSLPTDLWWIDTVNKDGLIYVLGDVSATNGASFKITRSPALTTRPANGAADGRNAVWAGYDAVFPLVGNFDDHTGNAAAFNAGSGVLLDYVSDSFDMNVHQGATWDGTYWHCIDTAALYKYTAAGALVLSSTTILADIIAFSGITGLTHLGDGPVINGLLYLPVEIIGNPITLGSKQCIAVVDVTNYAVVNVFDVSATMGTKEFGALGYNETDGLLYGMSYDGTLTMWKFSRVDGSPQGTLTITNNTGVTFSKFQGLIPYAGGWAVSTDDSDIIYITSAGVCQGRIWTRPAASSYEGLTMYNGLLGRLRDERTTGGLARVEFFRQHNAIQGAGAAFNSNTGIKALSRTSRTTFTMGCFSSVSNVSQSRASMSYVNAASGGTNRRVTLYMNRAAPQGQGVWDSTANAWLQATSPAVATLGQEYFIAAKYEGTTRRKFFINGALANTQNGNTLAPNDLDTLLFGYEDDTLGERLVGDVGFGFLYNGALADSYIAAINTSLTDSTFVAIS